MNDRHHLPASDTLRQIPAHDAKDITAMVDLGNAIIWQRRRPALNILDQNHPFILSHFTGFALIERTRRGSILEMEKQAQ